MPFSTIIGDSRAPSEGFFGTIGAAFESGISKIGSDILPNWVQSQASRQSGDQLAKNLFDETAAEQRMAGQDMVQDTHPVDGIQKIWFDVKGGNFGNMPVFVIAGALLIGLVIVLKKI
jgi:hypothetical protein